MTDPEFEIGEILVVQRVYKGLHKRFNGEEVLVMALPGGPRTAERAYLIKFKNGTEMGCYPEYLKRQPKRRDLDTLVSWESCAWQPKKDT